MDERNRSDSDRSGPEHANDDHWEVFAQAMDLTIEGHRLIAEEIGHEVRWLWRAAVSWLREVTGGTARGSAPPV
jgi:hypothetical protein